MTPLISVIIPYYKADKYIDQCVDSILLQTIKDIEIIIAVDAKDSDGKAFLEAKMWSRTRIVGGGHDVSANRNAGLDAAKGKYVFFIDADDFLLRDDVFERMLQDIENIHADMVIGEFDFYKEADNRLVEGHRLPKECPESIKTRDALEIYFDDTSVIFTAVWNILFKRELIGQHRFEKDMVVREDDCFMLGIFKKKPVIRLEKGLVSYGYRIGHASNHNSKPFLKLMAGWARSVEERQLFVESNYPDLKGRVSDYNCKHLQQYLRWLCSRFDKKKDGTTKEAKRLYSRLRKDYLSLDKEIRRNLTRREKVLDLAIRLNIFWRVYRIARTFFPNKYTKR